MLARTSLYARWLRPVDAETVRKGVLHDTDFDGIISDEAMARWRSQPNLTLEQHAADFLATPEGALLYEASELAPRRPEPIAKAATEKEPDANTPAGQLELLTRGMMDKWPRLTEQQARAKVLEEHPEIYDAMLESDV